MVDWINSYKELHQVDLQETIVLRIKREREEDTPSVFFSLHIRFGQSQTLLTLTKFIEKNIKIHDMKSILLNAS